MNDSLLPPDLGVSGAAVQPPLPEPALARWQPLRIGLVELFHYDSEEFWFRDGHLLLRGNNGTGKSKVLSLTLPFLFDAQIRSSRIEPDGDAGKKMSWNLLLGKHERRVGYAWIELGRIGEDGQPLYLTLGCGLSAVAARADVDSWFFITEQQRMGRDLWLISPQRVVLGKDRLGQAINRHGQVFDTAAAYRRAVDERLFHLGETRYGALMDTLIQLRQPQLSKKPNEDNLSHALSEALPPLADDLLADVAEAMNQLEEYSAQLAELTALGKAIGQFNRRYQQYAMVNARRQARVLRTAQTGFDRASRELHEARATFDAARDAEAELGQAMTRADEQQRRDRAALDEMLADPLMHDANRLEELERNAAARGADATGADAALRAARQRHERDAESLRACAARADAACAALGQGLERLRTAAQEAGLVRRDDYAEAAALFADPQALAHCAGTAYGQLCQRLRALLERRRADLAAAQALLRDVEAAERARAAEQRTRDGCADELADAARCVAEAEQRFAQCAEQHVASWQSHLLALRELSLADPDALLDTLAGWVGAPDGEHPAWRALADARDAAALRLAQHQAWLNQQAETLAGQRCALEQERQRLALGEDKQPPAPYQRDVAARAPQRPGAPFWQLVEFRADRGLDERARAGLEAALEASGLLDAWVSPDGSVDAGAGLFDTMLQARAPQASSLADWVEPAGQDGVDPAVLGRLLRGIACGNHEDPAAEAWIAPDGRFRLGPACGRWDKPHAEYIGAASRAQARRRRLDEVAAALEVLALQQVQLDAEAAALAQRRETAAREWRDAPSDTALRSADVDVGGREQQRRQAADRLAQAEVRLDAAEQRWRGARERLRQDAADLGLPADQPGLDQMADTVGTLADALHDLLLQANDVRHALPERERQQARMADVQRDLDERGAQLAQRRAAQADADARLHSLRQRVGAQVGELKQRLARARQDVDEGERKLSLGREQLAKAGEARARGEQRVEDAGTTLAERVEARHRAVHALEQFSATGLLAVALPELEAGAFPWSIDAALGVARRAEQGLQEIDADDDDWSRVQTAVSRDYSELLTALTALGHQAQADTSDYGMIVTIVYQNRPQRPDLIEASLRDEIVQRRELLTARETEVLENHLQAEVAAAIQRMLQGAERRLASINAELAKRPTSTGVRFRLVWQALAEGSDGAPVGLEAARKRLLNTSFDAWSHEDRQVVGTMLQSRIAAERASADSEGGGSLIEMLGRALDYRRWHRFRVQRWQDGQWRPLSGPASSGERALGLTVPLFAAVSSFYTHGGSAHAPRLVLLDEAFAGIDDAARAHCMALVREFDLDFVMTSEREWACYAELPGVAICQLQRREGVDAVYVSRWTWDGRARRQEADGARRFPAPEGGGE